MLPCGQNGIVMVNAGVALGDWVTLASSAHVGPAPRASWRSELALTTSIWCGHTMIRQSSAAEQKDWA